MASTSQPANNTTTSNVASQPASLAYNGHSLPAASLQYCG